MAIQQHNTRIGDGSHADCRPGASHWTGSRGGGDHTSKLPAGNASGARRSRRFNVRTKGGLEPACARRGWTLKRAEARAPFREAARREHLPVMAEGIYGR